MLCASKKSSICLYRPRRYNRRWAIEHGAAPTPRKAHEVAGWLGEWLADGTLAGVAWAGFGRLPQDGLYRIADEARRAAAGL